MRLVATVGLACLMAGCAQAVWVKEGATQQDFRRDSYSCERDVRQSGYYGTGLIGAINAQNFFDDCMRAAGYTQEQRRSVATSGSAPPIGNAADPSLPANDAECMRRFGTAVCPPWVVKARGY